jgi:hypothetical protein
MTWDVILSTEFAVEYISTTPAIEMKGTNRPIIIIIPAVLKVDLLKYVPSLNGPTMSARISPMNANIDPTEQLQM